MPSRTIPFINGEFYHVFNRGVAKMQIFNNAHDYNRFTKTFLYYALEGPKPRFSVFTPTTKVLEINKKVVSIVCHCLMPNHFHFLLRQTKENGISEFISKVSNSYTKYFNIKNNREGPLLQGAFKAVHVETNEQLLHLSRYIHLNPLVSYLTNDLNNHPWSSYNEYVNTVINNVCDKAIILDQFKSAKEYKKFILDQKDYGKTLESIKHQLIDFES